MTRRQEDLLEEKLVKWSTDVWITFSEQKMGFIGNLLEKMSEYYKAKDDNAKIGALCDIYILCMTSLDEEVTVIRSCIENRDDYLTFVDGICDILIERENWRVFRCWGNTDESIYQMMLCVERMADFMDYNFYKCVLETIKEVVSKGGSFDMTNYIIVKDTSPEAKAKWYKPNYEKYKIKG